METTNNKPEDQVQDSTTVEQVDVNIDELFGMPGAESVMLPNDKSEPEKKSVFTAEKTDMTFFDKPETKTPEERKEDEEKKVEVEETIAELNELITQEEDAGNK